MSFKVKTQKLILAKKMTTAGNEDTKCKVSNVEKTQCVPGLERNPYV